MPDKPFSFAFEIEPDTNIYAIILEQIVGLHELLMRQELLIGVLLADRFPEKFEQLIDHFRGEAEKMKVELVARLIKLYGA